MGRSENAKLWIDKKQCFKFRFRFRFRFLTLSVRVVPFSHHTRLTSRLRPNECKERS